MNVNVIVPRGQSKTRWLLICSKCHRVVGLTDGSERGFVLPEKCPYCNGKRYADPVEKLWRYFNGRAK